jgi:2-dehydropantoate 2-reductase
MQSERVVIVGAGAVGCYFGGMLARVGVPVTLIGRAAHIDVIRRDGVFIDRSDFQDYIRVDGSTDIRAVAQGTIVLLCVKTVDTETAAAAIAPHLGTGSLLISFQNGVDNVERIERASGINAIPAVVYVAAAMSGPGRVKHSGRGDLVIGDSGRRKDLERVAQLFERARIPCRISDDIAAELWTKLVLNCAYNAISAVTQARYGLIANNPTARQVMEELVKEVLDVARAAGIALKDRELVTAALKFGDSMANATSSTAQDLARGRPTEIDSLNGYISRRGKELGVPTPVNTTLYTLVKLLENSNAG